MEFWTRDNLADGLLTVKKYSDPRKKNFSHCRNYGRYRHTSNWMNRTTQLAAMRVRLCDSCSQKLSNSRFRRDLFPGIKHIAISSLDDRLVLSKRSSPSISTHRISVLVGFDQEVLATEITSYQRRIKSN